MSLETNSIEDRFEHIKKKKNIELVRKPLSDVISKVCKMIFIHVGNFHRKSLFCTCFKKFWIVEISFPIATKLNAIRCD